MMPRLAIGELTNIGLEGDQFSGRYINHDPEGNYIDDSRSS